MCGYVKNSTLCIAMNLCCTRISVPIALSSLIFVVATFICHMPTQPIYLVSHGPSFFIIYLFILHSFVAPHHHFRSCRVVGPQATASDDYLSPYWVMEKVEPLANLDTTKRREGNITKDGTFGIA